MFEDLPGDLGYDNAPIWWPLPWVALAGLLTAFAIAHLSGRGGHVPANGLKTGGAPTQPIELPGVIMAPLETRPPIVPLPPIVLALSKVTVLPSEPFTTILLPVTVVGPLRLLVPVKV